ncbi:MAG: HupE/UreJ family protein [Chitinophagaceae bacterium]
MSELISTPVTMKDFSFYFGVGWHHIISLEALDHILFMMVLVAGYTLTHWKQVLILVTAFTIGHSVTLALSVYDIVRFSDNWVEFLIPCTIVITALANLPHRTNFHHTVKLNYYLALLFGLIHGMGFANSLRFMLAKDQRIGGSLFAFNIGLEVGQIIVVALILSTAYLFVDRFHINKKHWVIFLSAAVFSLAVRMALERIPN